MDYTEFEKTLDECKIEIITDSKNIPIYTHVTMPNGEIKDYATSLEIRSLYEKLLGDMKDRTKVLKYEYNKLVKENEKLKSDLEYFENSHQQIVTELNYNIDEITTSRETISKLNTTLADVLMKYADLLDKMVEVNKHEH
jgi:predicted nuclease with TOPRIM domain